MTPDAIALRPAGPGDVADLLRFIRLLAEYEQLADQVVATEEQLHDALFGPRPVAEATLACDGDRPVGFALCYLTFSTFLARRGLYLEDLFVLPTHRGRGIGGRLLRDIAARAVARGYGRVEWSVLDWNAPAIAFYQRLGARPVDGWTLYRLSGDALKSLGEMPLAKQPDAGRN